MVCRSTAAVLLIRCTALVVLAHASLLYAATPAQSDAKAFDFFEAKIRPVLVERCYKCHSDRAEELKGGLHLDSREGVLRGGDTGPAIIPGDPDRSLLMKAIQYDELEMPPDNKLPDHIIADFRAWIAMGAPDPRTGGSSARVTVDYEQARRWWSFQPLRQPPVPVVSDTAWPAGDIDRFILARLEAEELKPAADADRAVLMRRLYVDLIGLPPTPKQQREFIESNDPRAYERLVDQLLASPHFAERWARHWLDLARYADSTGGGASSIMPDAWKYRDYVIRSFDNDKPYDVFVREQLAGDLLPYANAQQRAEQLTATGFLVLGPRNYITDDEAIFRMDSIDEQLAAVGHVFMAMTIDCARCHDHKFDPIPTADYYAMAGIFDSTITYRPIPGSKNFTWSVAGEPRDDPDGAIMAAYEKQANAIGELNDRIKYVNEAIAKAQVEGVLPEGVSAESLDAWITTQQEKAQSWKAQQTQMRRNMLPMPTTLMSVRCDSQPRDTHLRIRGNPHKIGDPVPRGFLGVLAPAMSADESRLQIPADQSGRLQLAEWITSPHNPLTARVWVNRVWRHLMGRGIVSTVDNFGTRGSPPTHPQLLDHLAGEFIADGQSLKRLIRRIVMSRTYRLGGADAERDRPLLAADPTNRLFGRRTRRSLDAETLRDSILAVSGELDMTAGGRLFADNLRKEYDYVYQSDRRSVYLPRFRNNQHEMFALFDAANPAQVVGSRDRTILPTQALFFINDPFIIRQSRLAAKRVLETSSLSIDERIDLMYRRTLARPPAGDEADLIRGFLSSVENAAENERLEAWAAIQRTLFECVDFRFVK